MRQDQASLYIFQMYLTWASQGCKILLFFRIYEIILCESPVLKLTPSSSVNATINSVWQYWLETDRGINVTEVILSLEHCFTFNSQLAISALSCFHFHLYMVYMCACIYKFWYFKNVNWILLSTPKAIMWDHTDIDRSNWRAGTQAAMWVNRITSNSQTCRWYSRIPGVTSLLSDWQYDSPHLLLVN